MLTTIISVLFWLAAMVVTFHLAKEQNRSTVLWLVLGLVFTPVLTSIVLFVLPKIKWKL